MHAKKGIEGQPHLLAPTLGQQLNPEHEPCPLSKEIDWAYFEKELASLHSGKGPPAHSVRLTVSLLVLRAVHDLSDEKPAEERWEMNAYFQYFSGEQVQKRGRPCAASDLVHFRQRLGERGAEKIFKHSTDKHGKDSLDSHVSIDSTAQDKNIACPTDAKLHEKIIDKGVKKAKGSNIILRRSYRRTSKQSVRDTYNGLHPKRKPRAIAGRSAQRAGAQIATRRLWPGTGTLQKSTGSRSEQ